MTRGWTMNEAHRVVKHANGLIAVEQGRAYGYTLSYNPDDDKFYVYDVVDGEEVVVATRRAKSNAVQFARLRSLAQARP